MAPEGVAEHGPVNDALGPRVVTIGSTASSTNRPPARLHMLSGPAVGGDIAPGGEGPSCFLLMRALGLNLPYPESCVDSLAVVSRFGEAWDKRREHQMLFSVAATKLSDLLQPKTKGEPVNVHVVDSVSEPKPDFDAMKRLIESNEQRPVGPAPERET
jgi:hypothetical protein